jgi:phosphoribosyl-ATP pyrophosphohydrolase/phosphoribosyl-AMP cyclohydrolase
MKKRAAKASTAEAPTKPVERSPDDLTDRTLRTKSDLDALDFSKLKSLVPVVVQNARTHEVLMLGFADRRALEMTLVTSELHFWSRSRGILWKKGETSGNVLSVVSLHADCDGDAVLARVLPAGPTCHTGERTCFGETGHDHDGADWPVGGLARLDATLAARATERPPGSYTVKLLDDENLRLKKLGEEMAELVHALAKGNKERAVSEAADVVYHVLVALRAEGADAKALLEELERRA